MKLFLLTGMLAFSAAASAQVGINTTTPNPSAALDIKSSSKALLVPRMTATEISIISTPEEGMIVYNTSVRRFWGYVGLGTTSPVPAGIQTTFTTDTAGTGTVLGQTFDLYKVRLATIELQSTLASPTTMVMTIRSGHGLTGPVILADTVVGTSVGALTFDFSDTPHLPLSGNYSFTLEGLAGGPWRVQVATGDPFPFGSFLGAQGTAVTSMDMRFVINRIDAAWKQLDN